MTLDLSLGEFSALTTKALRGAGYPWGIAADGAHAACMLAQAGLPAAEIIVRLLARVGNRSPDWHLSPNVLCPLLLGAALSDLGEVAYEQAPLLLAAQSVVEPLLVAPALRRSTIHWDGGHVDAHGDRVRLVGDPPQGPTIIRIERLDAAPIDGYGRRSRAPVDTESHAVLLEWAKRTYAPATETSRAGAGASTTDND